MLTRSCWDPPVPPSAHVWSVGSGSVTGDWATRYRQYETVPDGVVLTSAVSLARSKRNKLKAQARKRKRNPATKLTPTQQLRQEAAAAARAPRLCPCGCGVTFTPFNRTQQYATRRCSIKAWQANHREVLQRAQHDYRARLRAHRREKGMAA